MKTRLPSGYPETPDTGSGARLMGPSRGPLRSGGTCVSESLRRHPDAAPLGHADTESKGDAVTPVSCKGGEIPPPVPRDAGPKVGDMLGKPLSVGNTGPVTNRGRVAKNHVMPPRGVARDASLGRVSRDPEDHTLNEPSGRVRGDEHRIGPH